MATLLEKMGDIVFYIKIGKIAREYFGFTPTWLCQRLNGYDGNGNPCTLTEEQLETLRAALHDIARKIDETADSL